MCKSLLCERWLWEEPVWSQRFKQYTQLVFRRMLGCWWWLSLRMGGCTFGWEGSNMFLAGKAWELLAGWMCVCWRVTFLWWVAAGRIGLRMGDQMLLMKNPISCWTVWCACISIASLTLCWCQDCTGAMSLAWFQLMRWSCSYECLIKADLSRCPSLRWALCSLIVVDMLRPLLTLKRFTHGCARKFIYSFFLNT